MAKTYRIEIGNGGNWNTFMNWQGMKKNRAEGVMQAVEALYRGQNSFRMVNEQDRHILSSWEGKTATGIGGFDSEALFDQDDYFEILDRAPIEPHCRQSLKAIYEIKHRLDAVESRIDELEQMPPWDEG